MKEIKRQRRKEWGTWEGKWWGKGEREEDKYKKLEEVKPDKEEKEEEEEEEEGVNLLFKYRGKDERWNMTNVRRWY